MGRDESPSRAPLTLRVLANPSSPDPGEVAPPEPPTEAAPEPSAAVSPVVPDPRSPPAPTRDARHDAQTSPAVPARQGAPPPRLPYGRVVTVFLGSFGLTTAVVLGAWFGLVRTGRPTVEPTPLPAPIVMIAPAPIAAVSEPPAPADATDAVADASLDAPVDVTAVDVPPAPVARPAGRPRPPIPTVVVMETPRPVVQEAPKPAPAPAPAPAPTVPEEAARHAGTYVGRVQTRPMTLDLVFRPDGKLSATIRVNDGDATEEVKANGTWTLTGDSVTIALVESGASAPRVWSGRVADGAIDGRLVEDPRTTRRFHASR